MKATLVAVLLTAIFAAGFASSSSSASPPARLVALSTGAIPQQKMFGVMDDNPEVMASAAQAGMDVVKRTVWISPTNNRWDNPTNNPLIVPLPAKYRQTITYAMDQAQANDMAVFLELYPVVEFGPPLRPSQMRGTCDVAKDIIARWPNTVRGVEVGVEPNNYTFNRHQFNPDGTPASPGTYERWLAICYTKIKATYPNVLVIGGSLASRGEDNPHNPYSSISPVLFLQKLCQSYKDSGRTQPIMDWLDMHSYPEPMDQSPDIQHPYPSTTITIADYAKLEDLLSCFDGTAQPKPPVLWGESGYNTVISPEIKQRYGYIGDKPTTVQTVDELTQGQYVAEEIRLAYCQKDAVGLINFHLVDDPNQRLNWQSGFAYAHSQRFESDASSYTFKHGWPLVRQAWDAARSGSLKCGPPGSP